MGEGEQNIETKNQSLQQQSTNVKFLHSYGIIIMINWINSLNLYFPYVLSLLPFLSFPSRLLMNPDQYIMMINLMGEIQQLRHEFYIISIYEQCQLNDFWKTNYQYVYMLFS
ncbi:unnamed protein product [Paramecium primaurelia]|uniref:Transmembrane protein n=1 Tax=Paramecium primaurelia TaxID=5886 RepID=A0A8S1LQG6_PARPR|nr:unnamed protein product [Paramecium primaurelia]